MSFLELWDCFGEVKENWNENRALLEAYLEVIKFRAEIEKSYSNKLDKLCTLPFFKMGKNTLVPVIEKFSSFYMTKLLASKNFVTSTQSEVIQPLRDLLFSQDIKIREKIEDGKKLDLDKKKVQKSYEHSKEKYWKACRDTLLNPKYKSDYISKEEHYCDSYTKQLDALNRFNVIYAEEMGKNLAVFQICEEERLKHLRESLRKLYEAESTSLKTVSLEIESTPIVIFIKAINVFNPITELSKFIDDTKTGESAKVLNFETSPYGTSFKVSEHKNTLEDSLLLKINIKCWEGISLTEEDHRSFLETIHKHESRKSWLYFLNERRIKSDFIIPPSGFSIISKLMNEFLDSVAQDLDEYSAKMAIVLSQTFYYERGNEQIYLHTVLANHKLWANQEIWLKMIEDGINKEMQNYSQFCTDETSEAHKEQMSVIMISQLSSYIHIMKSFQIHGSFIKSVGSTLANKYQMPPQSVAELIE